VSAADDPGAAVPDVPTPAPVVVPAPAPTPALAPPAPAPKAKAKVSAPADPVPVQVGDRVLLRIGGADETPELRPAVVVRVWTPETVNLQVFLDGHNDDEVEIAGERARGVPGIRWCQSMSRGAGIAQWRVAGGTAA
jgi:hypothetical protein